MRSVTRPHENGSWEFHGGFMGSSWENMGFSGHLVGIETVRAAAA